MKKITVEDAYKVVSSVEKDSTVIGCYDYGDFYVFEITASDVDFFDTENPPILGALYPAVDKDTGEVFVYNIFSDISAYKSAKVVDISEI